eukprot:g9006.t1
MRNLKFGKKCKPDGLKPSDWGRIEFGQAFQNQLNEPPAGPPALLTTIQTTRNEKGLPSNSKPWLTVAVKEVRTDHAKVALHMSETSRYGKVTKREQVGWIAVKQGIYPDFFLSTGPTTVVALKSARVVSGMDNPGNPELPLGTTLQGGIALALVSQSTRRGGKGDDGGWARVLEATRQYVSVAIDEDQTCDKERNHGSEEVSLVVFGRAGRN